jgi:hypothetical protein
VYRTHGYGDPLVQGDPKLRRNDEVHYMDGAPTKISRVGELDAQFCHHKVKCSFDMLLGLAKKATWRFSLQRSANPANSAWYAVRFTSRTFQHIW